MKKILQVVGLLMIVGLALYFKLNGVHNPFSPTIKYVNGKPYEVIKHDIDTTYVDKVTVKQVKGEDIYHDTTIYVAIPVDKPIDTMAILMDYYAKNVYKDTLLLNDSLGYVTITDTISKNAIVSRLYNAKVKERTIKETTIVKELPKMQIFWGLGASFDKVNFVNNVQTNFLIKTKCDKIYGVGAGVDINKVPFVNASIYWKIK
jgi:hypothetical protein